MLLYFIPCRHHRTVTNCSPISPYTLLAGTGEAEPDNGAQLADGEYKLTQRCQCRALLTEGDPGQVQDAG